MYNVYKRRRTRLSVSTLYKSALA